MAERPISQREHREAEYATGYGATSTEDAYAAAGEALIEAWDETEALAAEVVRLGRVATAAQNLASIYPWLPLEAAGPFGYAMNELLRVLALVRIPEEKK